MARPKSHKPKYCFHKPSGRAYVRIAGYQIWLGKHGTKDSQDKYDAAVGQWISQGRPAAEPVALSANGLAIVELVEAYWNFAKEYYKGDPMRSDGHRASLRGALSLLVNLFGETPVLQFGPLKLTTVRDEMIKPKKVRLKCKVLDPGNRNIHSATEAGCDRQPIQHRWFGVQPDHLHLGLRRRQSHHE